MAFAGAGLVAYLTAHAVGILSYRGRWIDAWAILIIVCIALACAGAWIFWQANGL